MSYQVFTSYAVADRTGPMERFMEAFSEAARSTLGGATTSHVFHDYLSILEGTEWKAVLTEAACHASTAVLLVSPTYFMRPWCGRELEAFFRRYKEWRQDASPADIAGAPLLFPIIWEPPRGRGLPPKLSAFQLFGGKELKANKCEGLVDLAESGTDQELLKFARRLARQIAITTQTRGQALPAISLKSLDELPSAFEEVHERYDVNLWLATNELRQSGNLPGSNLALRDFIEEGSVRALGFVHTVPEAVDFAAEWKKVSARGQLFLVAVDAQHPPGEALQQLNELDIPAARLLLLVLDLGATTNAIPKPVSDWLAGFVKPGCFQTAHAAGFAVTSVASPLVRDRTETLVSSARQALMSQEKATPATSARLEQKARGDGIDTTQKSTL